MKAKQREKAIVRVSIIGILGNVLLVGAKAFIGFLTGSASIISDAINNLSDALSSAITIVGTKLSSKRPNKKHPFGYGRIEYLTATVIAAIIIFAGCTAIYESVMSLINQDKPQYDWVAFLILGIGIGVKAGLGIFFRLSGKKLESAALKNSGMDALFDVLLSAATLITAIISHFTQVYLEGYAGILIGLFILRSGILAMKESLSPILGERIDDELARQIKADVCAHPNIRGAYDLIIHSYGESKKIGSLHVEVPDDLDAKEIFALERETQAYLYEKYGVIMTIGVYASNDTDPVAKEIKKKVLAYASEHKEILQCHGFYLDTKRELISFDFVLSHEGVDKEEALVAGVTELLEKDNPKYRIVVNIDHDYAA